MMKKLNICLLLLAAALFSSCISDESTDGSIVLPTLSISGEDGEDMPVKNFNLGERCVIVPEVSYSGTDTLAYTWYVGTYKDGVKGEMSKVSSDKELDYQFLAGGSYYVHLTVTDGRIGDVQDYQINVNRTFEEGYLLVSNDSQGRGNLAFVKIMTPEEVAAGTPQITMEHIIERMNDSIDTDRLLGAVHGVITWPTTIHRILASTPTHCYFFDPNTFTVTSSIDYGQVTPGFTASGFYPDAYYPFAYDSRGKSFIHLNQQYMFGYEYSLYKGLVFDDCFQNPYDAWGSTNYNSLYVDYAASEVRKMNENTGSIATTGTRLADEAIVSAFISPPRGYYYNDMVLTYSKNNPLSWHLHEYEGIEYIAETDPGTVTDITVTDRTAQPARGTHFVFSEADNRYFYPVGNRIYVFLPEGTTPMPDKNQWAISFAEGENVTYMDVNAATGQLYVATVTEATGRGNFYIYKSSDVKTDNQGHVQPEATYKNVADRITQIVYKPRL